MHRLALTVLAVAGLSTGLASSQDRVFTIAGGGPDDRTASPVLLYNHGVAADAAGNFYVPSMNRIFKVDPSGHLRRFAGTDLAGFSGDGRHASRARLSDPRGLAFDAAGNLLVADYANSRIRRIDRLSGVISTIAGSGSVTSSGDGGPALSAGIGFPHGVASGPDGSIYVSQTAAHRVRRIDPATGLISTFAGTGVQGFSGDGGPAGAAQLRSPHHLAVDAAGNLYIADTGNRRIRRVDAATGSISTVAGSGISGLEGDGGPALQASFVRPAAVVVDVTGNLFITDYMPSDDGSWSGRVRRVDAVTGIITRYAGGRPTCCSPGDGGPATEALLFAPEGLALDAAGDLLIADLGQGCYFGCGIMGIRKVTAATQIIQTVAGSNGDGDEGDGGPAVNAILSYEGLGPMGLDVDGNGNVVFANYETLSIRRVDASSGHITTIAGLGHSAKFCGDGGPSADSCVWFPRDAAFDDSGNVYIADTGNHRIRKISASAGIITTIAGNGTQGFNGDNLIGTSASLALPNGVAVDGQGNVFIADTYNNRVRRLGTTTNRLTTVAGTGVAGYSGDGQAATIAQLAQPRDIALDAAANIYIVDPPRIRRVDAITGVITTVAGDGTFGYSGDGGPATSAAMNPSRVAVDPLGNMLIADQGNRIRRVDGSSGIITTVAGNGTIGFSLDGTVASDALVYTQHENAGIAMHPVSGFVFADSRNGRIRHVESRSIASGVVPDGSLDPNQAMDATVGVDGRVTLSWQPSCVAGDTDYAVYHGPMDGFDAPLPLLCSTGGQTSATFTPASASSFYLIVPRNAFREGSAGVRSDGTMRPQGPLACFDRHLAPSCGP
jgi:sugar lactone lactonase YvrE